MDITAVLTLKNQVKQSHNIYTNTRATTQKAVELWFLWNIANTLGIN